MYHRRQSGGVIQQSNVQQYRFRALMKQVCRFMQRRGGQSSRGCACGALCSSRQVRVLHNNYRSTGHTYVRRVLGHSADTHDLDVTVQGAKGSSSSQPPS